MEVWNSKNLSVLKPAAETASFFTKSTAFMGKMAVEGSMHAVSQGFITGITGGNIEQSLLSGAVSSVVGSIVNASGAEMLGSSDAAIILFGTVSGGVAARLTGGNFWEGAAVGLVVSGLNHAAHNDNNTSEDDNQQGKKITKKFLGIKDDDSPETMINKLIKGMKVGDYIDGGDLKFLNSKIGLVIDKATMSSAVF